MMVCPIAVYGAECRPLTRSLESHLNFMEMSMLRWSAGISHLECITNEEVQRHMTVEPITKKLWDWCLQWYSQVVCTDTDTVANVAHTLHVAGKCPVGMTKTKVDGLPGGQHGVPQSKVSRCMKPSEMEKTDWRFKADPIMGKWQDKEEESVTVQSKFSNYIVTQLVMNGVMVLEKIQIVTGWSTLGAYFSSPFNKWSWQKGNAIQSYRFKWL